jgi:uncharacterized protein YcnI
MTTRWRLAALAVLIGFATLGSLHAASAHTDTDVVAVPAGSTATVTLRPTHGCGDSPTIMVAVRAPVAGAVAEAVDGWSETSTPDGGSFTVLEWSGGVLPTDEAGAFPVEFVVPDTVGELLVFPAIQACEDGSELAWISGDPEAEFPAPRLLILAPGSEPAATIDDVPLDAPGRDQLVAIVDVDNPTAPTTIAPADPVADSTPAAIEPIETEPSATEPASSSPVASEPVVTDPSGSVADSTVATDSVDTIENVGDDNDDGSSSAPWIIGGILLLAAIAVAAIVAARRRGGSATDERSDQI